MRLSPQFSRRALRTSVATGIAALIYTQWRQWYGLGSILVIVAGAVVGLILATIYHAVRHRISSRPQVSADILVFHTKRLDEAA